MAAAFKVFDLDGDGFITREELKIAMEMIGEHVTEEQIDQVILMADTDHDEKINYEGKCVLFIIRSHKLRQLYRVCQIQVTASIFRKR